MGQKQVFLNILKDLVFNFLWICSVMKTYIICYVLAQIPYEGKFLFLRYRPKCSQPNRLQDFLINHISRTNTYIIPIQITNKIPWFFACWYKITWIKSWSKIFCEDMVKNGSGQSGHGTLKLTVSQTWIDGMNWYFACSSKFRTAKIYFNEFWVCIVRNGRGHSAHETLKSAVSKEWVYKFSWFFACWLWGSNFWLNRHHTLYLWLLNLSLLQLYLLDP